MPPRRDDPGAATTATPPTPATPAPPPPRPATAGRWAAPGPAARVPAPRASGRRARRRDGGRGCWWPARSCSLAAVIGAVVLLVGGGDGDDDPATSSTPACRRDDDDAGDRGADHDGRPHDDDPTVDDDDLAPDDRGGAGHHPATGTVMLELDDDDTIPTGNSEILAELTATLAALPLVAVEWAAATTPGVRRRVNEDAWGQDRGTFAIADGMGGRGGGAMAARLAIDRFFARLRAADDHPDWRAIVHAVNADVVTAGEREGLDRVGTTLLAAVVAGPVVTLVHVGDSRAYRLTRQPSAPAGAPPRLDVLTHDHTVRAELLAAGLDVGEYRQRGVALHGLTSFIGLDQDVPARRRAGRPRAGRRPHPAVHRRRAPPARRRPAARGAGGGRVP